ncbi:biotin--[acetyl-CoA-carboxylase] ligase [Lacinutrix sp. MedPE-SW]|uniref:biotin--[acetyl-CoA-carboxylase] ligase n=1 Tax=Lacinutrix sp. MedPE-SW TaxID=1860087 RepID=UPI0009218F51|nr:biotin--[acetyl-CoA-carboxylase] ligase [Lacinutrix sp. MedPE-SW]OIQ18812.1 MAG: biotin--[acetyl-CoA-carboxylase] ligase [Lacinutrix sp. MedPE-SW]
MRIIKLDAIDSTNTFLKEISSADVIEDFTVVVAKTQTNGKGQMGNVWSAASGENLTFSVFKDVSFLNFEKNFYLSLITALALRQTLQQFNVPKLTVKWPNDILSADKKLAGILIENVIKNNKLVSSVIGIGLNVNQTVFKNLPRASSMKLLVGTHFNLDEVLETFLKQLKIYFEKLKNEETDALMQAYNDNLFRKNKPSTFKSIEGSTFSGFIQGISNNGNLLVLLEDNIIKEFTLNEITLMY